MSHSFLALVAFIFATLTSLVASSGVISGGGAGFPRLPKDIKFEYDCALSISERAGEKSYYVQHEFTYDQSSGSGSGVLQIATTKEGWNGDTKEISIPLEGHVVVLSSGLTKFEMALDSTSKVSSQLKALSSKPAYDAQRISGHLMATKVANGLEITYELSITCKLAP